MNEAGAAQDWLKDKLEADGTLMGMLEGGVWFRSVPKEEPTPVIKIDGLDASDLMVVGSNRVWADLTFLVRGVYQESGEPPDWTTVNGIADRIDTVLHRSAGSNGSGTIYVDEVFRVETFIDETTEPDLFLHSGGIYRLRARAL